MGDEPSRIGGDQASSLPSGHRTKPTKSNVTEPISSSVRSPSPLLPSSASISSENSSLSAFGSARQSSSKKTAEDSDRQTTTTPSTSVCSTPNDPKELVDPFLSLSTGQAPEAVEEPAVLTPVEQVGSGGFAPSTPSTSVTSNSEANDILGPLPASQYQFDRPSGSRPPSHMEMPTGPPARAPLPSPPASWGMSEFISGSPYHNHPQGDSYFAPMHQDPQYSPRNPNSSRRTPPYSPFRNYHENNPRPSTHTRTVSSDHASPSFPMTRVMSDDVTPTFSMPPGGTSTPSSSGSQYGGRSPRVRNTGSVLAPHGSFTSVKVQTPPGTSVQGSAVASDSQLYIGTSRYGNRAADLDPLEVKALQRAAERGDQLAMYRLGWRPDTPHDKRYVLGTVEDVWGSVSPMPTTARRSSKSSTASEFISSSSFRSSPSIDSPRATPLPGHQPTVPTADPPTPSQTSAERLVTDPTALDQDDGHSGL